MPVNQMPTHHANERQARPPGPAAGCVAPLRAHDRRVCPQPRHASRGEPTGQPVKAAVPFGVPSPVGPSHPLPAVQIGAPHVPFLPDVTSFRLAAWA